MAEQEPAKPSDNDNEGVPGESGPQRKQPEEPEGHTPDEGYDLVEPPAPERPQPDAATPPGNAPGGVPEEAAKPGRWVDTDTSAPAPPGGARAEYAASETPPAGQQTPAAPPGQSPAAPAEQKNAGVVLEEEYPTWRGLAFAFGTGLFVVIVFAWLILGPLLESALGEVRVAKRGEHFTSVARVMEFAFAGWVAATCLAIYLHRQGKADEPEQLHGEKPSWAAGLLQRLSRSTFWHVTATFGAAFVLMLVFPLLAWTADGAWWWRAVYVVIVTACAWPLWTAVLRDRLGASPQ